MLLLFLLTTLVNCEESLNPLVTVELLGDQMCCRRWFAITNNPNVIIMAKIETKSLVHNSQVLCSIQHINKNTVAVAMLYASIPTARKTLDRLGSAIAVPIASTVQLRPRIPVQALSSITE